MSPRISVIIVNYNAGMELARCVQSVAESGSDLEIIVVDNNSQDKSIQQLGACCHGENTLRILHNKKNLGFAVACNQGSLAATGEFLLYLNPDCIVEPTTMLTLLQCLENDPLVGMAGGLILNHDGSEQRGCRRAIPTPWKSLVNSFGLKRLARLNRKFFSDFRLDREPLPDTPVQVDAISGACMLVSRKAFTDVGPMDEGYFLHCEDLDWCMQFGQRGWQIMFVPQARLFHSKGSCSASRPIFVEWSKHKGMVRFYKKFFADNYPWPMLWLVWLGIWLRFGLFLAKHFLQRLFGRGQKGD
ncbi:MAG: glycosyltransferase family 2 protein [Proteobacteria bacterium]|nr:glycosyltransferase family 2 protein [Pseudomonadota bacterium]MBU1060659.1 glycosyltransferase family 2 protein [Pseudomonadota bacterium]